MEAPSAYFVGISAIKDPNIGSLFVLELPAYHWPTVGNMSRGMWEGTGPLLKRPEQSLGSAGGREKGVGLPGSLFPWSLGTAEYGCSHSRIKNVVVTCSF